jgi:hypothetical protein
LEHALRIGVIVARPVSATVVNVVHCASGAVSITAARRVVELHRADLMRACFPRPLLADP